MKMDPESRLTHALSSIVSGFVAATMGTPADVVKTRVMNQPFDAQGRGNELNEVKDMKFAKPILCIIYTLQSATSTICSFQVLA